jgi:putative acetyltransferase
MLAMMGADVRIIEATSAADIAAARELFLEYAESLGFSLCFQGFDKELAGLPGDYAPPSGRLLLARVADDAAGCVALHSLEDGIAEMKRLYVRPAHRGTGLGRRLIDEIIRHASAIGYERMRLDTVEPKMKKAVELYRAYGFKEIAPYRSNPIAGALYMELALGASATSPRVTSDRLPSVSSRGSSR